MDHLKAVQLFGTIIQCKGSTCAIIGTEQACRQLTANQRAQDPIQSLDWLMADGFGAQPSGCGRSKDR